MTAAPPDPRRALPQAHRVRAQPALLRALAAHARATFADAERPWDPTRAGREMPDLGRGLLDCLALPLHVLWTYQDAWARETFLPTATLGLSRARLLELVAPAPTPAVAATALQHFTLKAGRTTTIAAGFRVSAPAADGKPAATFETLAAADLSHRKNSLLPYLPNAPRPPVTAGAIAAVLSEPPVLTPPPGEGLVPQLERRLAAGRAGDTARRNAERQRARALQRAETLTELQNTGAIDPFSAAFQALCEEVCEAQRLANEIPPDAPFGALSEAQEMLLGELSRMARQAPQAIDGLNAALEQRDGESDADFTRRLDQTTNFLDVLVTGLLQRSRDTVARLRGPDGLSRLDRAYAGLDPSNRPERGFAAVGTDSLYLVGDATDAAGPRTHAGVLKPGDWLILSQEEYGFAADGAPTTTANYTEAVRITRAYDEAVAGPTGRPAAMTRIVFAPPLKRAYRLADITLIGNIVPVSHGKTVRRIVERNAVVGGGLVLTGEPLTFLPDPAAPSGRSAAVSLRIDGQDWTEIPHTAEADPGVFYLSLGADGVARLAIGGGAIDAPIPAGARIEIAYREGAGPSGNKPAKAIKNLDSSNTAISATYNPLPAEGGVAAQLPEDARAAGIGASILDRAVSVADVRALALAYGSVRRASVFRDALRARERLTVVVSGQEAAPLSAEERSALHAFLAARVPPGVTLSLKNRTAVGLEARIRLMISEHADPLAVIGAARVRLGLDRRAEEPPGLLDPDESELGRDVHLSDLHGALAGIAGLARVHVEAFGRTSRRWGERRRRVATRAHRVAIAADELALWATDAPEAEPVVLLWEVAKDLP